MRLPLSDRLRRRALGRPQGDRRGACRRCRRAARAVDLYPRARADRPAAARARLGHRLDQSAPLRHGLCDRRPRALAGAQLHEAGRGRFRRGRSRRLPAHHPRRRCRFQLRDHLERGLVRPAADRQPVSRPLRFHRRRCRAYLGALCRLRHERRDCRCHEPVLAAGGASQRLGAGRHPRCLRGGTLADHEPGLALCDVACRSRNPPPRRGAGRDRGCRAGRASACAQEVGRLTYEINVQQYACAGLNFGSYYDRSPIIAYDGAEPPAYTMDSYTPSTVPGCRTPHLWCGDGTFAVRRDGAGIHAAAV